MRYLTRPIGVAACLCLLTLQFSGLHVHIDDEGFVGGPETAATHNHGHSHSHSHSDVHIDGPSDGQSHGDPGSGNEYEDARDVSLLDLSPKPGKIELAALLGDALFTVAPLARALQSAEVAYPVLSGRHTRWRPPLRAPPQLA